MKLKPRKGISKSKSSLGFEAAAMAILASDLVTLVDSDGYEHQTDYVGWENEGEEDVYFVLEASRIGRVLLTPRSSIMRDGANLQISKYKLLIRLYKENHD